METEELKKVLENVINKAIEKHTKEENEYKYELRDALQMHTDTHHKNDTWVQAYICKEKRKEELWQRGKITFVIAMMMATFGTIGSLIWIGVKSSIPFVK